MKIQLERNEPVPGADSAELSKVVLARFGLLPRKKDAMAKFHQLLLELYERKKACHRDKKPEKAVMTVEDMALFAGIKRQTMYDYLKRWLDLQILKKTSFVADSKLTIGYELNGGNLEAAFKKAEVVISNHIVSSMDVIRVLQNEVKKEKLRLEIPNTSTEHSIQ